MMLRKGFSPHRCLTHEAFGKIRISLITVVLKGFNSIRLYAIVDTGAVTSLFPRSFYDLLRLSYEDGKETVLHSATQEEIPVRVHKLTGGWGN